MSYDQQMTEWVKILNGMDRKPLYDFGWSLIHVPEPRDERKVNQ